MDTNSIYFANVEVDYRREMVRRAWAPVRRRRKRGDRHPHPSRPLNQDFVD